jgi:uncharacterized membrane protein (GlpM family)
MIQIIIKLILSSGIVVLVSEIAKKSTFFGGLIASIPLISVLSMLWLYLDTKDIEKIKNLSNSILWMIIPSLTLFLSLPILINIGFNFYLSLIISIVLTIGCYSMTLLILTHYGIKL